MELKSAVYNNLISMIDTTKCFHEKYSKLRVDIDTEDNLKSLFHDDSNQLYISTRTSIQPILQKGPSCGIAALCMAVNYLSRDKAPSFDDILEKAKNLDYTNDGECFTAKELFQLTCAYHLRSKFISCETQEDMAKDILKNLLDKNLILIAYDRDFNNEPCMKKGYKAHWGLLTGVLFLADEDILDVTNALVVDENISSLYHQVNECRYLNEKILASTSAFRVYLMHGWSIHTRSVDANQLIQSNFQLESASPSLKDKYTSMKIPDGGDITNLSKCFIVLEL